MYFLTLPTENPGSRINSIIMSTLTAKIMVSKHHLPPKATGYSLRNKWCQDWDRNIQGEPASSHTKSNKKYFKKTVKVIKRTQEL